MESYTKLRLLGEGAYGRVFLAREKHAPRRLVCVKQLFASAPIGSCETEIRLLQRVRHPNVVRFINTTSTTKSRRSIVMEFCPGGDLRRFLRQGPAPSIHEDRVWYWLMQLCLALSYLHDGGGSTAVAPHRAIWHRDLKTSNVFLNSAGFLVLGDLGIATESSTRLASTVIGTPLYMAPEIWDGKPYDGACDLWALGCTIYEICMGKTPFEDAPSTPALIKRVFEAKYTPLPSLRWSVRLRALVDELLRVDPTKRPAAATILRHHENAIHLERYLRDRVDAAHPHEDEEQAILRTQCRSLGIRLHPARDTEQQPSLTVVDPKVPSLSAAAVPPKLQEMEEEQRRRVQRERERQEQLRVALRRMQELRDEQQAEVQQQPPRVSGRDKITANGDYTVASVDSEWKAPVQMDSHLSIAVSSDVARPSSASPSGNKCLVAIEFSGIPRAGVPLTPHARSFAAKTQSLLCRDVRVLRRQESTKASARYKASLDAKFNKTKQAQWDSPTAPSPCEHREDDAMADCLAQLEAVLRAQLNPR